MRRILIFVLGILAVADAAAADLPAVLRGPIVGEVVPLYPWSGIYGGAQIGFSTASIDFSKSVGGLIAREVRLTTIEQDQQISSWPSLPKKNPIGGSFGAFIGYNWQWEDAVVGLELNYNRTSLSASSGDSITRSFFDSTGLPDGHHYLYVVTVSGAASVRITDWGTFRIRGAWAAGPFLPYGFVAFAVGRSDISRSGTVSYTATDKPDPQEPPTPQLIPLDPLDVFHTQTDARKGVFAYGAAAGLGVDVALVQNLFLRAEWEFVQFAPVQGMHIHINTVRTALGLKF